VPVIGQIQNRKRAAMWLTWSNFVILKDILKCVIVRDLILSQFVIQVERTHPGVVGIVPTDFARRPSHS